jgi:hypothetical protein
VPDPLKRGSLCSACHPMSGGPYGPGWYVLAGVDRRPAEVVAAHFHQQSGRVVAYDVAYDDDQADVVGRLPASEVVRRDVVHPDHPDHGFGKHQRVVTDFDPRVAVCEDDGDRWPCEVLRAWHAGRASNLGPLGEHVVEATRFGEPITGTVIAVDAERERWEIRTDSGGFTWVEADRLTVDDRTQQGRHQAAAAIAAAMGRPHVSLTAGYAVELAAPDIEPGMWFAGPAQRQDGGR